MASLLTSFYKIGNLLYILVLILILLMDLINKAYVQLPVTCPPPPPSPALTNNRRYALLIPLVLNFAAHGVKSFQLYRKKVE